MAVGELTTTPRPVVDPHEIEEMTRDVIAGSGLFGAANVVMQLARLEVGRGVAESTVDSGRVDLHPYKRQRTTGQYLIVALLGTDAERKTMRDEVNRQHKHVVRKEGESDVPYSAFDPELQLWVAACIYVGFACWLELYRAPLTDAQRDAFYWHCSRLATTLQVPEEMWPDGREAFATYWAEAVQKIAMDDVSRGYLRELTNLAFMPRWHRRLFARMNRFLVVGHLPVEFREQLGEPWTERDQRRFEKFLRRSIAVEHRLPAFVRRAGVSMYEWDVKRRIARGRRIV